MKIFHNYSLKDHNTLKIDVSCREYVRIESDADIDKLATLEGFRNGSFLILGDGANVLFTTDLDTLVIHDVRDSWRVISEDNDYVVVAVDAGMSWHTCVATMVAHGWGGLENMALIPGTVGAAPVGNIAAYGQNFSDVCEGVDVVVAESGELTHMDAEACEFEYRDSIFKNRLRNACFVSRVYMKLSTKPCIDTTYWSKKHGTLEELLAARGNGPYTIQDMFEVISAFRSRRFPDMSTYGTAGSFFKNPLIPRAQLEALQKLIPDIQVYPAERLSYEHDVEQSDDEFVKVAAGQILDAGLGLAGYWEGNVGLYEKHALILVTNGKATGKEVDVFATSIQEKFFAYCGIRLEREVITV